MENLVVLGIGILVYVAIEILLNGIYYFSNKWQNIAIKERG